MNPLFMALSLLVVVGQTAANAAAGPLPEPSASCALDGDEHALRIELLVANGGAEHILEVTPGALEVTSRGNAVLFVELGPAPLPVLSPGADATFVWSGRLFGDGSLEVGTSLSARHAGGSEVRIESIDCGDLTIGDPDRTRPAPVGSPHPHRTQAPTSTASETPTQTATPVQTRTERCPGDCDGSGTVRIDELVTALEIALGRGNVSACPAADANANSRIEVSELMASVRMSLVGCTFPVGVQ
jgi:hypothetical protein